jgi:hypothetical protein
MVIVIIAIWIVASIIVVGFWYRDIYRELGNDPDGNFE